MARGRPKRESLPDGIGEEPDSVIALREGVTTRAIRYLRETRGIPAAHSWGGDRRSKDWREKARE